MCVVQKEEDPLREVKEENKGLRREKDNKAESHAAQAKKFPTHDYNF